jgi:hypothetical protein
MPCAKIVNDMVKCEQWTSIPRHKKVECSCRAAAETGDTKVEARTVGARSVEAREVAVADWLPLLSMAEQLGKKSAAFLSILVRSQSSSIKSLNVAAKRNGADTPGYSETHGRLLAHHPLPSPR